MLWLGPILMARSVLGQHAHLNAGAMGSLPGNPLYFANGDAFATNSGWFLPLRWTTNEVYAGYHLGSLTLTALASTPDNGGPSVGHAAPGANIEARIVSLEGPVGGAWAFWDSDGSEDAPALTFSVPVGETHGTGAFRLSENDGAAGADPYGHVHGRKFTATLPGLYTVGIQLFDISENGNGGGPLHPPSNVLRVYMQAGVTIAGIEVQSGAVAVRFAAETGLTYRVQRATSPQGPWSAATEGVLGAGRVVTAPVSLSGGAAEFFRLSVE
jgi:hypothetical protein